MRYHQGGQCVSAGFIASTMPFVIVSVSPGAPELVPGRYSYRPSNVATTRSADQCVIVRRPWPVSDLMVQLTFPPVGGVPRTTLTRKQSGSSATCAQLPG